MFKFLEIDSAYSRAMFKLVDLILINLLFIVSAVPIITIGAAITSTYTVLFNYTNGNKDRIISRYFQAFRQNWRQSTVVYLFIMLAFCLLTINLFLFPSYDGPLRWLVLISLIIFTVILYLFAIVIFAYLAKFNDSIIKSFQNVLKIILDNIFKSLLILLVTLMPLGILIIYPQSLALVLYYFIFVGFSMLIYIYTKILSGIFNKYIIID